ncbi:MAG: phosphoglycerate dehydrogenase [Clostridia bacterium]|nr:phosphoglycerate dehydrogenase [Clostridia bacterium]
MGKKVAFPFRHHASLVCPEAKQMLRDAGFELICNDTGEKLSASEQHEMIRDAFAVVAGTESYDREMLTGCDSLRAVIRFGVGTDNFDLAAMREMGIQVGVIANYNAVAEFTLTLMLSALKNYPRFDMAVREGKWSRFPMRELTGKTVSIIGYGRIGRRLSELLSGFHTRLLAYDPYIDEEAARQRGVTPCGFEQALSEADVVSLHLPATPDTFHIINRDTIARMKDGAYLINTSRGSLVDEQALYEALTQGKLSGAGLDVYEVEPVTADNPLFSLDNDVLSPHCAALTYETNYNGGIICANSIINVLNGGKPVYSLW